MMAGAVAGSMTAFITNPIWVVNTRQTVRVLRPQSGPQPTTKSRRMGFLQTILHILKTDGPLAFFRGLGPALILVINPILQYTVSSLPFNQPIVSPRVWVCIWELMLTTLETLSVV